MICGCCILHLFFMCTRPSAPSSFSCRIWYSDHKPAANFQSRHCNGMNKVAIVGAGPAGICAARHFLALAPNVAIKVFERQDEVGGTWNYDAAIEVDDLHQMPDHDTLCAVTKTSLYKNLKSNLPKEIMGYPDFPFSGSSGKSFVTHEDVLEYIQAYCRCFDIYNHIHCGKEVMHIEPVDQNPAPGFIQWTVTSRDVRSGEQTVEMFDAVLVCSGHFDAPRMPSIENIACFKGVTFHSRFYRKPEPFRKMTVAILGRGSSALDIAIEVASVAERVYLCHRGENLKCKLLPNIEEKLAIVGITPEDGKILLTDGSTCKADVLIFCTGYRYEFPFLSNRCEVEVQHDKVVAPLYKHMFHKTYPSMIFIGIPFSVCPLPLFHLQSMYAIFVLTGKLKLPSQEEMETEMVIEMDQRILDGLKEDQFHLLGARQWEYNTQLASLVGVGMPKYLPKLYNYVIESRVYDLLHFRNKNYKLLNNDDFFLVNELEK